MLVRSNGSCTAWLKRRSTGARLLCIAALVITLSALAVPAAAADADVAGRIAASGFFLTLLWAFAWGIGVSLTPCLYPMIPVTLSVIGARNIGQKPLHGFLRALTFVLGMAVIYTGLGVAAVVAGKSVSFVLSYWEFWVFLAVFFAAMGLSMMGLFTIQLPPALAGKLQGSVSGKGGYVGAFLVGLVTGVAASPCGTPVLAGLAAYAAEQAAGGHYVSSIVLFFAYSMGMGMLFLILGSAPSLLTKMPRSGGWMEDVKRFIGAMLIGVGVYYLSKCFPSHAKWLWVFYWIAIIFMLLGTAAAVAVGSSQRARVPVLQNVWRGVAGACLLGALYVALTSLPAAFSIKPRVVSKPVAQAPAPQQEIAPPQPTVKPVDMVADAKAVLADNTKYTALASGKGAASATSVKPDAETKQPGSKPAVAEHSPAPAAAGGVKPEQASTETPDASVSSPNATTAKAASKEAGNQGEGVDEEDWLTHEPSALAAAAKYKLPVMIDFTAEWCANCKKLEAKVFTDPQVAQQMARFIKIKVDVTNDADHPLAKKYKALSFPTIAFIDAQGKRRADMDLKDYETADKFLARLKQVAP